MSILEDAIRRQAERPAPRQINYQLMNERIRGQRAALTRAKNTGDPEKIAAVCKKAVAEWTECGAWPDDWSTWQRALDDAMNAKSGHWADHVDIGDL